MGSCRVDRSQSRRTRLASATVAVLTLALACSSSSEPAPVEPSISLSPSQPPTAPSSDPQVVDAISGAPLAGVTVRVQGVPDTSSGTDGQFSLVTPDRSDRLIPFWASSAATVERASYLRPVGPPPRISLIPSSFDLEAFNQMFRGDGTLRRWVSAPALIVERRMLLFGTTGASSAATADRVMSEPEAAALVDDLTWALPQLTGGVFTSFESVGVETATSGTSVDLIRPGAILVARYEGLERGSGFVGYTRWFWNGASELVHGFVMLDAQYEAQSSTSQRRALRAHELGHALGWRHVTGPTSVMNAAASQLPTEFDRAGSKIAHQRPPLNRAPDTDQALTSINRLDSRIYSDGAPSVSSVRAPRCSGS
jgi:hypothetical protein